MWNCFFGLVGKVVVSVKGAYFSDTISSQGEAGHSQKEPFEEIKVIWGMKV